MNPLEPELNPEAGAQPNILGSTDGSADNEGAMAKADLYKLANYSFKLFKKIQDEDQLEAWVQAKITKAADYIASVYHYLEYEMEFSDYGKRLDNSDVLSESQKVELKNKLVEAKEKIKELKKKQAEKIASKKVEEGQEELKKAGDSYKTSRGGTVTKTATGVRHEKGDYSDETEAEPAQSKPSKASKSASEKKADKEKEIKLPKPAKGTRISGMKNGEKFEKVVKEAAKSPKAKKDYDKDGKVESEKDEVIGSRRKAAGLDEAKSCNESAKGESCPVHGLKECPMEESAPSAGMTKKEKSTVAKKAVAGKDIGKPGKNFDKVAKAAEKGGAKDGKAVAAAAMWKSAKKKATKESVDGEVPATKSIPQVETSKDPELQESVQQTPQLNESTDLARMKEFLTRLNG